MQVTGFGDKVAFIWSVADILRGGFKALDGSVQALLWLWHDGARSQ
jgi:hypothetical protein